MEISMSFAQSLTVNGPGAGTSVAITATSTAAQNLGANTVRVQLKSTVKTHIRFGESGVAAATTDDVYLTPDVDYVYDVEPGKQYFRAIRSASDGTLHWAKVA